MSGFVVTRVWRHQSLRKFLWNFKHLPSFLSMKAAKKNERRDSLFIFSPLDFYYGSSPPHWKVLRQMGNAQIGSQSAQWCLWTTVTAHTVGLLDMAFVYLPTGISWRWFLLKSRARSEAKSPIWTGRWVISLHEASSSIRDCIRPISSGKLTKRLLFTIKPWRQGNWQIEGGR